MLSVNRAQSMMIITSNINGDSIRSSARVRINLGVRACVDQYSFEEFCPTVRTIQYRHSLPTTFQNIKSYLGQGLAKTCTDI